MIQLRLKRAAALLVAGASVAVAIAAPVGASSSSPATPFGLTCVPGPGGVRICEATLATRVPSWDGVLLDVTVVLPPAAIKAPYPLIVGMHGYGTAKQAGFDKDRVFTYAQRGYATLEYSARGIGLSCGVPVSRTSPGCDRGWIHLADARYEVRDTQYLAGVLADQGFTRPAIGVTGTSYGGGQSLILATLRDRTILPSGRIVPWRSPDGTPMRVAAAAPKIGWSDLAYALVPTGRTLDTRARNPYGRTVGFPKYSYFQGLFAVGLPGYYAPAGADRRADITTWKGWLDAGPPYPAELRNYVLPQFERFHSSYYMLDDHLPGGQPEKPAPMVIYNAFTDDIMPPTEALRYRNRAQALFPNARVGLVFGTDFGHNRASLTATPVLANHQADLLFARYLKHERSAKPLTGVITETQGCNGASPLGPFRTRTWRAQHPGEVVFGAAKARTFTSAGGSATNALQTDPFAGGACPTIDAADDPGAATYLGRPAKGRGYTLIGSPTITARLGVSGRWPQVDIRLWDVAPDGSQTLVTHGIYVPRRTGRAQTFQVYPAGWHFATGHRPKLELLGRDYPYAQPSTGTFSIRARGVRVKLPVRERRYR